MEKPLLSIIIATYNRERYIKKALSTKAIKTLKLLSLTIARMIKQKK